MRDQPFERSLVNWGLTCQVFRQQGPRGRITKDDLHNFVKSRLQGGRFWPDLNVLDQGYPLFLPLILQLLVRWNGFR